MEEDDDALPISALQHFLYCPRQCALIHVERQWAEDVRTAEGRLLHERVDRPGTSRRAGVRTIRAMPLRCRRLGLAGVADAVELHGTEGVPYPVEYKRGRPKTHRADEVQLCAQALCLEEMTGRPVPEGALFYGEERHRTIVPFDTDLRALTERVARDTAAMVREGRTPPPDYQPRRCDRCSLLDLCQPESLSRAPRVAAWLARQLRE